MNFYELFPVKKEYVYLNTASTGPIPLTTYKRLQNLLNQLLLEGDVPFSCVKDEAQKVKKHLAELLDCKPSEIGLCKNTSHGLFIALTMLPDRKNKKLIVQEDAFPVLKAVARFSNYEIKLCDLRKTPIKALKETLDKNVVAVVVDWVHFYKGYVLNLKEVGDFLKERDIYFIVDGIQGAGIVPISLDSLKVDFFVAGSSKWLLGGEGMGFLYIKEDTFKKLKKNYGGWLSYEWKDFYSLNEFPMLRQNASIIEEGTYNIFGMFALSESLKLLCKIGIKNIYAKVKELVTYLRDKLEEFEVEPKDNELPSGIVAFRCSDSEKLFEKLKANKIIVSLREGFIRVSPHFFNEKEEIDKLVSFI